MLNYKRQILLPLFIASLLLAGALGGLFVAAYQLVQSNVHDDRIENVRFGIISLQNAIGKTEAGQRGYLLTNNLSFVDTFEAGKTDIEKIFGQLSQQLQFFPELKPKFAHVQRLVNSKLRGIEVSIQIQMNSGSYSPHLNSAKIGVDLMQQIDRELKVADMALLKEKNAIHHDIDRSLKEVVTGAALLTILIIALLFAGYRRTIRLFEIAVNSQNVAEEFSHDAYHDALTGLPNRRYFDTHLRRMLSLSKRNRQTFAVLYLDLDGFKRINDEFGHDAGDDALKHAASRFTAALRESDFLARLGGDEFVVLIDQYYNDSELTGLAGRVLRYINHPFLAGGHQCQLGVSIGISRYPTNGQDAESLIAAADAAMYQAKRAGKNRALFAPGQQVRTA